MLEYFYRTDIYLKIIIFWRRWNNARVRDMAKIGIQCKIWDSFITVKTNHLYGRIHIGSAASSWTRKGGYWFKSLHAAFPSPLPQGKTTRYSINQTISRPQRRSGCFFEGKKISTPISIIETIFFGRLSPTLVAVRTILCPLSLDLPKRPYAVLWNVVTNVLTGHMLIYGCLLGNELNVLAGG